MQTFSNKLSFKQFYVTALIVCLIAIAGSAQKSVPSLEINGDNTVTFRAKFPGAETVLLKGTFVPKQQEFKTPAGTFGKDGKIEMSRDGEYWTYTTGTLPSELYTLSLIHI